MDLPRVVIDTNVVIAAMRSKQGASSLLVSLLGKGLFTTHLSVPVTLEYEEVLLRQRRQTNLTTADVSRLVDAICAVSQFHEIHFLWRPTLRDVDDEAVLELAVAASCQYIITYNKRDFTGSEQFGIEIMTPKEFLITLGVIT